MLVIIINIFKIVNNLTTVARILLGVGVTKLLRIMVTGK